MKHFRLSRRRSLSGLSWNFGVEDHPSAGLSWNFENVTDGRPEAGLSWNFEEAVLAGAPTDISPAVAATHISKAIEAAAAAPGPAHPAAVSSPRASARRRLALGGVMSGVTAKVLLGTMTALAATGGAAAAGLLPDPVQVVVADVAGAFGLELPSPDDDESALLEDNEQDGLDDTESDLDDNDQADVDQDAGGDDDQGDDPDQDAGGDDDQGDDPGQDAGGDDDQGDDPDQDAGGDDDQGDEAAGDDADGVDQDD